MGIFQVKDRVAVGDNKYIITEAEDGKQVLVPSPDEVVEEGTPLNKETLQPLFNAEYNSAFIFNISDNNEVTPAGEKTLSDFYSAIMSGCNTVAYGLRSAGFTTIRPVASVFASIFLIEETIGSPQQTRTWTLTESTMSFIGNAYLAVNYVRNLDENDDLNDIDVNGVYSYRTASIPKNCPFVNAGIVVVEGSIEDNDQKIQTVTRYGSPGESAFRGLSGGSWTPWAHTAVVEEKTFTVTTSTNGNCSLNLPLDGVVLLSAYCTTGSVARMCIPYRANTEAKWAIKVLSFTDMTPIANAEVSVTCFYTKRY